MRLALSMRTADRSPKRNYVAGTLGRLIRQGVDPASVHLCATSPDVRWLEPIVAECPVTLHVPDRVLRPNANGLQQIAVVDPESYDWILLLEDDLKFCADFLGSVRRWIARHARPDRHVYRFFGFSHPPAHAEAYDVPLVRLRASQAVALRRDDALDFLAWGTAHLTSWRRLAPWGGSPADPGIAWDKFIACWALTRWPNRPGVISHPHFVQHVGDDSSLHRYGARNDRPFAGEAWSYQP